MKKNINKIVVVGLGYVGTTLGILLSKENKVTMLDIDNEKVNKINKKKSPIKDSKIDNFLKQEKLNLTATNNSESVYEDADFIVIATPTNFDETKNTFDTSIILKVIDDIFISNKDALIVIKSTVPIGFTEYLNKHFDSERIIFSPEFLREGSALEDNLYPSRIIVGGSCSKSKIFGAMLESFSKNKDIKTKFMSASEAEAVKLFSNTYLAMRVAYFNELDSLCLSKNLNTKNVIDGVSLDERIGDKYNNPSFGYGGYCLPKDTKQLLSNFNKTPQNLIQSIVNSNETRKNFLTEEILKTNPKCVGFYRLIMKTGSDNYRSSAILGIINRLKNEDLRLVIYEPTLDKKAYDGIEVINDLATFKDISDIIVANRKDDHLMSVSKKIFTRDIFNYS